MKKVYAILISTILLFFMVCFTIGFMATPTVADNSYPEPVSTLSSYPAPRPTLASYQKSQPVNKTSAVILPTSTFISVQNVIRVDRLTNSKFLLKNK